MNYWAKRIAKNQEEIQGKTIKQINSQFQKYYGKAAEKVITDFENVYSKILRDIEHGRTPTPADLYKLDKYWEAQAQMRKELEKLGNKQIKTLTSAFETNFFEVYYSIALPGDSTFNTVDKDIVNQLINGIWVSDGKQWSDRVWENTSKLAQTLNEELIHIVATGRKDSDLKKALQERFGVSYHRAETLVRTEVAHIQTEAAKQRYKDYGIEYVEVLVDSDNRTCELCKDLIGKRWRTEETPPLPVHPNERCCLVPVID